MVVVASTDESPSKYQLYMFGVSGNALHVQWQGDGTGSWAMTSPLYDGKYIAVGSCDCVFHIRSDDAMIIGLDRLVEH
jgi:hypothetical protein